MAVKVKTGYTFGDKVDFVVTRIFAPKRVVQFLNSILSPLGGEVEVWNKESVGEDVGLVLRIDNIHNAENIVNIFNANIAGVVKQKNLKK